MPSGYVVANITATTIVRFTVKEPHIHYYTPSRPLALNVNLIVDGAILSTRSRRIVRFNMRCGPVFSMDWELISATVFVSSLAVYECLKVLFSKQSRY